MNIVKKYDQKHYQRNTLSNNAKIKLQEDSFCCKYSFKASIIEIKTAIIESDFAHSVIYTIPGKPECTANNRSGAHCGCQDSAWFSWMPTVAVTWYSPEQQ